MRLRSPLRAVTLGIQATSALAGASVQTAATAANTAATAATTAATSGLSAGLGIATLPVREGAKVFSQGLSPSALSRHCWRGADRAWIEVRGLTARGGDDLGSAVLDALRAHPGVTAARLNFPLSRVVVDLGGEPVSLADLCRVIADVEQGCRRPPLDRAARPASLPGDGLVLISRAAEVGVTAAGLGTAIVGRALRWPRLPVTVDAAVAAVNYQPWLRRLLEERIGKPATDTVLTLAVSAAHTVTLSPASLAVDLMVQMLKSAELRAEAQAWSRHEPDLARHADQPIAHGPTRPVPRLPGPVERHAQRSAWIQAVGAAFVGAATRSLNMAGTAALVAVPKASRTARESFAAALGRGLADQHGVLPLDRDSLRRLDSVDTLIIDPRVLCSDQLRVVRIRGAREHELSAAWSASQARLAETNLRPGWHPVDGRSSGDGSRDSPMEALFSPAHHPLASALVAEARRSGVQVVSVDTDALGDLRPGFDDIRPLENGSVDDGLAGALAALQEAGHTVAVLSAKAAQALSSADVALGMAEPGAELPWHADLLLTGLAGAWQVVHALPAARTASQRGVEIATGASALGALLMLPGVRGRGPGPVTTGAAAALLSSYLLARRAVGAQTPQPAPVYEWHAMSVEQVREVLPPPDSGEPVTAASPPIAARAMGTARRGLALAGPPRRAVWQFVSAVRAELSDPLTPVLALGAAASAVLGSPLDAAMVGSVLTANSVLAASQRLHAERLLNRLLAQQVPPARKVATGPDGVPTYTDVIAAELRPGDVIEIRPDEVVPADGRLIDAPDLEVDESSLTGESLSVVKQVDATPGVELAERRCMVFAGTTVVTGTAVAVVTAVGAETEARRAADLASGDSRPVGLQYHLSQLTKRAWPVSLGGGTLVSALGLFRGTGIREAIASGIAVTVAAVPEGMPLVATLAQQASARRLTDSGVLVRIPRSVEALGRVDVVCFDKTGTLSENRLRVAHVHPAPGRTYEEVLRCAAHAAPTANGGRHAHATDTAIVEAALAVNGSSPTTEPDAHLPFRSGRSFSASVTGAELTVKGAPEVVLAACDDAGPEVEATVARLAADGLRVIAVARRQLSAPQAQSVYDDDEPETVAELCDEGLTLAGLLGLSDTPRAQSAGLLSDLRDRNVGVRLITGDHPITAAAIAQELGMPVSTDEVITGAEWNALSRKDQERAVAERVVFARMSPENKVQIVQVLERTGRVCAMVGDGSNDAAAIRAATVGIGVVARGSDPARAAADVVLLEGRVESLLAGIDEGRQLWRRAQAAVSVLLGGNAGEVAFAIIGSAITGRAPLNARQLLLVNMLTDGLPAAALAVSPPTASVTSEGRGPDESALLRAVAVRGATTAAAATAAWAMAGVTGLPRRASTVALVALVTAQLGQTVLDSHAPLVVFTAVGSLGAMATLISIPGVSQLLGCTPLGPLGWAQGLGTATAATIGLSVLSRLTTGPRVPKSPTAGRHLALDRAVDHSPRQSPESPQRPHATTPRTPHAGARSAAPSSPESADRPERRSSTYDRQ